MKLSVSQKPVARVAGGRTAARNANFFYAQIDLKLIRDRGCITRLATPQFTASLFSLYDHTLPHYSRRAKRAVITFTTTFSSIHHIVTHDITSLV
jgi:hypothetical protein